MQQTYTCLESHKIADIILPIDDDKEKTIESGESGGFIKTNDIEVPESVEE